MKVKSQLFTKILSILIVVIIFTITFTSVALAGNCIGNVIKTESLADVINLEKGETADVIVEFTSPSLLDLNAQSDHPIPANYEQILLSEQKAILDQLGIIPRFNYTGVINAVAITATANDIRMLEKMQGVEDVYLSQRFKTHEMGEYQENTISMSDMMGMNPIISSENTGDGVLVAVIDSGITFEHEAFNNVKYVQNPSLTSGDLMKLGYSNGYYNEKIPFYRDYTKLSTDGVDISGHGSHVAGIIAGYAENEDGTVKFSGIAPGAQICAMRVRDEVEGTEAAMIAAFEDAYKLGVDIINISLGIISSFRLGGESFKSYDAMFKNLESVGVMVVCSIGNSGSMAENTPMHMLDENCVDYGTVSFPAIYPGNIGVGSVDGSTYYTNLISIGGQKYMCTDNAPAGSPMDFNKTFGGTTVDIAYFDNYGKKEDYVGVDVTGKIMAVKRGELSFTDKCKYAAEAGAIGLIVINGATDPWGGMVINNQSIPAMLVEYGVADKLPITNCVVTIGYGMVETPNRETLSSFTSVGVTPDLEIGLDILGVGGSVTSVSHQAVDEYITYRGTSMAAPTVSGIYALLYQIYKDKDESGEKSRLDIANYIDDVTQSTATLLSDELGNLYSPRFQGSGFINFDNALATNTYISTPLVCLGYDKSASGSISVEYELVNIGKEDVKYTAKASAITDFYRQISPTDYKNMVTPNMLDSSSYTYVIYVNGVAIARDEVFTIPAESTTTVKLELKLTSETASKLSLAFPYGYYLDGFVEFYDVNDPTKSAIHGGYVSFVGDWLKAPAIEPLTRTEVMDWLYSIGADVDTMLPYFAAMHDNANYAYTDMQTGGGEYYLGENPLADGEYIPSYTDRNAISASISNADKIIYDSLMVIPSLLRNCKTIRYVVSNSENGEIYMSSTKKYVRKDSPLDEYQYFQLSQFLFDSAYLAPNEFGQITKHHIPSGTNVTISIYTLLDHPDATERLEAEYTLTMDYTAPELYYEYDADTKMLTVKFVDSEYIAGIILEKPSDSYSVGERVDSRIYADKTPGIAYTETFDLSDYDGDFISITVSDYASNMVTMVLSLTSGDVSNVECFTTLGDGLTVDFADPLYLYKEVDFTVVPADGYCFTDTFALFVNGEALTPISVENNVYFYTMVLSSEEIILTSTGSNPHSFVSTVTKEQTCVSDGELSHVCSNCSYVGKVEVISSSGHVSGSATTLVEPTCTEAGISTVSCTKCGIILKTESLTACGHTEGDLETLKEATCVESGVSVVKCVDCGSLLETTIISATGHDHTLGDKATAFSPAVCGICGESYGSADSDGILVLVLVLSIVATTSTVFMAIVVFVKKKR